MDMKRFEGLTIEDLEAAIVAMKEAEEAQARAAKAMKEAELEEARVAMLDAAVQYLLKLGAISEEEVRDMNVAKTLEDLKSMEHQIAQYAKMMQVLGGLAPKVPKIKVQVHEVEDVNDDEEILKKFLSSIGAGI